MRQELPPNACATAIRPNEQIFKPDAGTAEPRRERREEERKAGRLTVDLGENRLRRRALAEQRVRKVRLGAGDAISGPLVRGELANQLEQQRDVGRLSWSDPYRCAHASDGGAISR